MDPVVFMHIPKTGGITFGNSLEWMFQGRPGKIVNFHTQTEWMTLPDRVAIAEHAKKELSNNPFIFATGHNIQYWRENNFHWVSVIREPVTRLISWFYYMQSHLYRVPEALREPFAGDIFHFVQTFEKFWPEMVWEQIFGFSATCNVHQALEVLEDGRVHVGLFENFDNHVVGLCHEMGLPIPYYPSRKNRGNYSHPPDSVIEKLTKHLALETEFYRQAKARIERRLSTAPDLSLFYRLNTLWFPLAYLKKSTFAYCLAHYNQCVCFGAGTRLQQVMDRISALGLNVRVVDSDRKKWGTRVHQWLVEPPEIIQEGVELVLITSCYHQEIFEQIQGAPIQDVAVPVPLGP